MRQMYLLRSTRGRRDVAAMAAAAVAALWVGPQAEAATYSWVGPFTGITVNTNPWSNPASWSTGTPPASAVDTALVFNNFDGNTYAAANNLSSPFLLNSVTFNNDSANNGLVTVSDYNTSSIELTGASPTVTYNGPGGVTFGSLVNGSSGGLILAPASGTTTLAGGGNGVFTLGSSTAVISGAGGLTLNQTGLGYVSLVGTNTFSGGVTVNSGSLQVGTATAMGTGTLAVNGGTLRGSASFANNVTANADLNFVAGSATLSGTVGGSGGVHLSNGYSPTALSSQSLTLSGVDTYTGATTIDPSPVSGTYSVNTATLTVAGTISNSPSITVGTNGTLTFTGSSNNTRVSDAAPVVLSGARLSVSGLAASTPFTETFGALTASGLDTFSYTAPTSGSATSALTFASLALSDDATLFFRGAWLGTAATPNGYALANFTTALTNVSDPAGPTGGTNLGLVPYAVGNSTSATAGSANAFVTYNAAAGSVQLVPLTGANVAQVPTAAAFAAAPDQNVNFNASSTSSAPITLAASETVNALSNTAGTYLAGGQTVTVSSGTVLAGSGTLTVGLTHQNVTLNFGASTGYIHLGASSSAALTVTNNSSGSSQITGSGGVVISGGPPASGSNETALLQNATVGNPFTGGLTVNGATVQYTADNELGAAGGAVTLDGGFLYYSLTTGTTGITLARPLRLGAAGGGAAAPAGETLTISSNITGPGGFSITSGNATEGVTALTGANSYAGPTDVSIGTLNIASDANLGAGPLVLFSGGTLQFAAPATLAHAVQVLGAATIDTNGNNVALGGSVTGAVSVGSAITKVGAGTLSFTGADPSFSTGVNASSGAVAVSGNGTLPQVTSIAVASGATFAVDNTGTNLPDRLNDLARVTLPAGGTFQFIGNPGSAK